ncbi:MAG TPA: 3-isopropylmalate dehydratase small subunit [Candidatus Acidoferrales bacterium]|nr:3-isopropylmalate dehydratase small subunit [Candidatus Acidoferrales bacterium]
MMQPFSEHQGLVAPLDRVNVDTDQMIPKQFCKLLTREGYGRLLFYDWRYFEGEKPNPEFVLNHPRYEGASILLGRANIGCGSSREHAAWGVLDFGFRVVVAPSFADIFYNNCFKNGVLPVQLSDAQVNELFRRTYAREGYNLLVDLEKQTVSDDAGLLYNFEIDPFRKYALQKGLDEIGLSLEHEARIAAYEKQRNPQAPLYEPDRVDLKLFAAKD